MAGKTPLTEAQARALAHWWGGDYQRTGEPAGKGEVWHGVVFPSPGHGDIPAPVSPGFGVFSQEEALRLENLRNDVNPGAPDWVG